MAKYEEVTDDLQKKFDSFLEKTGIPEFVEFKLLHSETAKLPMCIYKASEFIKHLNKIEVLVVVNETMFDMLDENSQNIVIEETQAHVYFDSEKDKVVMLKPDYSGFSGIIKKYGFDEHKRTDECIKAIIQQKADATAKAKEDKKNSKKKK